ncbi:MAG: DUF3368 domain-containing protein [Bacteroidetes bacterium]|nr:DUF3368 domain-containing protein [Bacteroidota bacterium]
MLKVILDTTPILTLLKISKFSLLKDIYEKIIIPEGVYQEIEIGKNKEYYINLAELEWVKIEKIKNNQAIKYLAGLDKGEAEVIILAEEINADIVVIDEKIGREYAKRNNLNLTGTLGILIKAKNKRLIKAIKPLIDEMQNKGVWLNDKLIISVLKITGEK